MGKRQLNIWGRPLLVVPEGHWPLNKPRVIRVTPEKPKRFAVICWACQCEAGNEITSADQAKEKGWTRLEPFPLHDPADLHMGFCPDHQWAGYRDRYRPSKFPGEWWLRR